MTELRPYFKGEESLVLPSVVDYCKVYANSCKHFSCHVNSAVVNLLMANPNAPLTQLSLANNYVGPNGLKPILTLIEECQTIVTLDLKGNGLDNESIEKLCNVLSRHLSIQGIDISDNPITHDAGKFIMLMLERNKNIVYCNVNRTDIFQTLIDRITMKAEENSAIIGPRLKKSTEVEAQFYKLKPNDAKNAHNHQIVPSRPMASRPTTTSISLDSRSDTRPVFRPHPKATKVQLLKDNSHLAECGSSNTTMGHAVYHLRPPPPATASMIFAKNSTRSNDTDREEMREIYYQRRQLYNSMCANEVTKAAQNARYQLMMLESADKVIHANKSVVNTSNIQGQLTSTNQTDCGDELSIEIGEITNKDAVACAAIPNVEKQPISPNISDEDTTAAETDAPEGKDISQPKSSISTDEDGRTIVTSSDPTVAPFIVPYTNEEKFKQLFEAGGKAYKSKNLDSAYLKWNEAMTFAAENKNREWIAIVTNNLQRLSYELLVTEGTKHSEKGRLDDADKSFAIALEVAKKARNAAWEADMIKARKNVQHAVFQRTHKNSSNLFDRATKYVDQIIDAEDDKFISPDGQSFISHSSAYYNDWQRMLLLKEAMEGWVDVLTTTKNIPGISTRALQDVISASILNVAQFLISHFFSTPGFNDNPEVLPKLGISRYTCDEAKLMHDLFVVIVDSTDCLSCPSFDIVAFCIMGQLAIAMNQMSLSIQYLENAVSLSEKIGDIGFCAYSNTFLAIAALQRADFGVAETTVRKALVNWSHILDYDLSINRTKKSKDLFIEIDRDVIPTTATVTNESSTQITSAGGPTTVDVTQNTCNGASICDSLIIKTVPISVLRVCHGDAHLTLIHTLVAVHRYYDAVKALERYHHLSYADTLHQKINKNFTTDATVDHMTAVAAFSHSTLVYFNTEFRFDWNIETNKYTTNEILYIWAVPAEGEINFSSVDVTTDFNITSIAVLMKSVREALFSDSIPDSALEFGLGNTTNENKGIFTEEFKVIDLPINESSELLWKAPLATLYSIMIGPVVGFLQAHGSYDNNAVITVIPSGYLWGIPWSALYDIVDDKFLIEKFAIQLSFGALFSSFSSLSSLQCEERKHRKTVILVAPMSTLVDSPEGLYNGEGYSETVKVAEHSSTTHQKICQVPYPVDSVRIQKVITDAHYKASQQLVASIAAMNNTEKYRPRVATLDPKHTNCINIGDCGPVDSSVSDDMTITTLNRSSLDEIDRVNVPVHLRVPSVVLSTVESLTANLPITKFLHVMAPTTSYACNIIEDTSGGILIESSVLGTNTILKSSDIAQIEIFASVVTLSETNMNHKAITKCGGNTRDGTLSLIRCFAAAGCSAVVASLWRTSDMAPSSFFEAFYKNHLEHVGSQQSNAQQATDSDVNNRPLVRQKDSRLPSSKSSGNPSLDSRDPVYRNKAVALALATRECLENPELRFAPRHWAPYFIVGTGV